MPQAVIKVYVSAGTQVLDTHGDEVAIRCPVGQRPNVREIYQAACRACRPARPGIFVLVDAELASLAQELSNISQCRVSIARRPGQADDQWSVHGAADWTHVWPVRNSRVA